MCGSSRSLPVFRLVMTILGISGLAAGSGCQQPTVRGIPVGELVDLTHPFDADTIYWPTAEGFRKTTDFEGLTEAGYWYSAYSFCTAEHGGTHLDAPVHFAQGAPAADQVPLDRLLGQAAVVDVVEQAGRDRDYLIQVADFEAWEQQHGRLPEGVILLLRTGFSQYWPDRVRYLGTDRRGPEAVAELHFPGLAPDAARWLVAERSVRAVGIDTASIDYGQSRLFEAHRILFAAEIPVFENVAALDRLPATGAFVIGLPMKIRGGSGGPLRIIAVLP
ncbi:MAG: cyclase family protein [Acidobacteriota bacterium]